MSLLCKVYEPVSTDDSECDKFETLSDASADKERSRRLGANRRSGDGNGRFSTVACLST